MSSLVTLYGTYLGMYIVQSVVHSAVIAIVAEIAVQAWRIRDPWVRQRFHIAAIILPIFLFPLYQGWNPDRGSTYFRLDAMFDSWRWLTLKVAGPVTMGLLLVSALLVTTLVFLIQELVPVARHMLTSKRRGAGPDGLPHGPALREALDAIPGEKPAVTVVDDDDLVLFSSTGREPAVFISKGALDEFSPEQLRVAIAHEVAHIRRSRKPILLVLFILRVTMFFNPVALIEFRKAVLEEEKICDSLAVSMVGNAPALAEVLEKFRGGKGAARVTKLSDMTDALEQYSYDMLLSSRIKRLQGGHVYNTEGGWLQTAVAVAVVAVLNYHIV